MFAQISQFVCMQLSYLSVPDADPLISDCISQFRHSMPNFNFGRLSRSREGESFVIECHKLALIFHTLEVLGSVTQRLSEIKLFVLDAMVFEVILYFVGI
jgi:hypothetical protein